MAALLTVSLLLATFVFQTYGQCPTVTVSQDPETNVETNNIKLNCTYTGIVDYSTIAWQTSNGTSTYRQAFTDYRANPEFTGPELEFQGRLTGLLEGNTHTLTIINANISDDLNAWRCVVYTLACSGGSTDTLNLILKKGYVESVCMNIDGVPVDCKENSTTTTNVYNDNILNNEGNLESKKDVEVTCIALSDPKPDSLVIDNVEIGTPRCERVPGTPPQPFSCSATRLMSKKFALHSESKNAVCEAKFPVEPMPIVVDVQIIMLMRPGEISLLSFVVLIGMACIAILICCIMNCICIDKLCCSEKTTDKICIPQMCSDMEYCAANNKDNITH